MNNTEKKTVTKMIKIYCAARHGTSESLCADCLQLNEYAMDRLERCTFGEDKPTCQQCPIHCYRPDMKLRMQEVMRYSGPRMIFSSPMLAIVHLVKGMKPAKKISHK
ncbi:nitrous oxide-stimulated promoter family protein [uncultured Dysgonomonas sp.]|uniref:nitrous oxide-stimulated promoter family protein n=1 Tax=uncultured Dysgonomonas sp. TaxID=206096 RepID=UPI0025EABC97|nr:nitrous oxide-stimulated promoter family protein [uncultured Dysgonomonas sp.]